MPKAKASKRFTTPLCTFKFARLALPEPNRFGQLKYSALVEFDLSDPEQGQFFNEMCAWQDDHLPQDSYRAAYEKDGIGKISLEWPVEKKDAVTGFTVRCPLPVVYDKDDQIMTDESKKSLSPDFKGRVRFNMTATVSSKGKDVINVYPNEIQYCKPIERAAYEPSGFGVWSDDEEIVDEDF